ncbi:MAG: hypothetical protein GY819_16390 [Planctomycetaceae bacterium]|nr:hypothetical protein [Planctomycetaceae bacterium]MCP4464373.1 hypothetical protein [Planctomycetaceae bacterium]MDG1808763.1 hypothetical protein [Pirellulaceae bacterium]MDG2105074.1 hypothetical protein [Pirellulaceae bacterium]
MKYVALICGLALFGFGLAAFFNQTNDATPPANEEIQEPLEYRITLIPALMGAVIAGCGTLAIMKPDTNSLALHAATGVALLGGMGAMWQTRQAIGQIWDGTYAFGDAATDLAILMSVLCWGFILAKITSMSPARQPN